MSTARRPLRVVQWTTGNTGTAAVRGIVGHPQLELVGCYAFSADKVGVDVGTLAGIDPLGVRATDDVEALLALRPDCVSYMPFRPDIDHIEAILASGSNLVTTMYMTAGAGYGEDARQRIADAARRGHSTLYATGIYPGHANIVALALSGMSQRIESISVTETVDMAHYANAQMFRGMGIDRPPDDPNLPATIEAACGSFKEQVRVTAAVLGIELDGVKVDVEFAVATETTDFGFMTIQAGHVAGFKGSVSGVVGDRRPIQCRFVWKVGEAMTPSWPIDYGYRVEIEGVPAVRCQIEPLHGTEWDGAIATAMPAVNAIPAVVAAAPGVLNYGDLPLIAGSYQPR